MKYIDIKSIISQESQLVDCLNRIFEILVIRMRQFNEEMLQIFDKYYQNIFGKIMLNLLKFNSVLDTSNDDEETQISNMQFFIKSKFYYFLKYSSVYLFEILYKIFSEFFLKKFENFNGTDSIGFGLIIIFLSSFIKIMEEKKLYEYSKDFY